MRYLVTVQCVKVDITLEWHFFASPYLANQHMVWRCFLWCCQIICKPPTAQLTKCYAVNAIRTEICMACISKVSLSPHHNHFFWSLLHLSGLGKTNHITLHRLISQCPLLGCTVFVHESQKAVVRWHIICCSAKACLPTVSFLWGLPYCWVHL